MSLFLLAKVHERTGAASQKETEHHLSRMLWLGEEEELWISLETGVAVKAQILVSHRNRNVYDCFAEEAKTKNYNRDRMQYQAKAMDQWRAHHKAIIPQKI